MQNIYVALENLRSLYNIGAIFRTCSFFGVYNLILVGYSGKNINTKGEVVLHEEIKKSSLGSEKDLNISMVQNASELIQFATQNKLKIYSIEQNSASTSLEKADIPDNCILVFGNEVEGVSEELLKTSDQILEIPRAGFHNSLNVTTACGIVLYKASTQKNSE